MIKRKKLVFELVVELSEEHATAVFYEGVTKEEVLDYLVRSLGAGNPPFDVIESKVDEEFVGLPKKVK